MSASASENAKNMAELDKFKRRMIRTVARLMKEKKSQSEVFEELKKESGCDCQLLWQRMRILTLKKLKRLLLADDHSESIPEIARMSLTDWLLFDLVLVHEKVDVIGRDGLSTSDSKPMRCLFELVQKFSIMNRRGELLANAWANATVHYNSMGHQCSPMLLQRRWYQLMEHTRELFYQFWFTYRGNAKLLANAEPYTPNQLHMDIAKSYPEVVTKPFLDWERRIQKNYIIMPEEFEAKLRSRVVTKSLETDDNVPDIVVVEPVIETIDLGQDSDDERTHDSEVSPTATNLSKPLNNPLNKPLNAVTIKDEPKDTDRNDGSDLSDIEVLESTQVPQDTHINKNNIDLENDNLQDELELLQMEEDNVLNSSSITDRNFEAEAPNVKSEGNVASESVNSEPPSEMIMPQITNVFGNVNVSSETLTKISNLAQKAKMFDKTAPKIICLPGDVTVEVDTVSPNTINTLHDSRNNDSNSIVIDDDDEHVSGLPQSDETLPETYSTNNDVCKNKSTEESFQEKHNSSYTSPEPQIMLDDNTLIDNASVLNKNEVTDVKIKKIPDNDCVIEIDHINMESSNERNREAAKLVNKITGSTILDNDIEIVPKITTNIEIFGIENDDANEDEIHDIININFDPSPETHTEAIPKEKKENNDCMKFFDDAQHMNVNFADDGIEIVDDGIEYVEDETEADTKFAESEESHPDCEDETSSNTRFDLKLIMDPVVYTVKLDHMSVFKDRSFHNVYDKVLINNICIESKPVSKKSVKDMKMEDVNDSNCSDDKRTNDDLFKYFPCNSESQKEEIKKVKLSSKLLRKPKHLSYNPIQLCKNPDFNTKLKRLPIGFYSSSRNLLLLKACKPMTIDVNKTFESKLQNGVMYLEGSDTDIQKQDYNYENKLDSTVLPSAMPVQSLIDITKISDLIGMSKHSSESTSENLSDESSLSERSKVINLKDLSEIRRINQQLLTAEVSPITVKSGDDNIWKTQVIANTRLPSDIYNGNSYIKTKDESNKIVDIDEKFGNVESKNQTVSEKRQAMVTSSFEIETLRQKEVEQFKTKTFDTILNNKSDINKKTASTNHIGLYRRKAVPVSWLSRPKALETFTQEDALLTADTLNKMLNLLDGKEDDIPTKSKKKKRVRISNESDKTNTQLKISSSGSKTDEIKESNNDNSKRKNNIQKLKINIVNAKNGPLYKGAHCCWAKEKILCRLLKSRRLSKHPCQPLLCECCCKDKLSSDMPTSSHDEHDNLMLQKACESIESVVQQTREMCAMKNYVSKVSEVPQMTIDNSHQLVVIVPQSDKISLQSKCVDTESEETTVTTNIDYETEIPTDSIALVQQTLESSIVSDTASIKTFIDTHSTGESKHDTNTMNGQSDLITTHSDTTASITTFINTPPKTVSTQDHAHVSPRSLLKSSCIPVELNVPTQITKPFKKVAKKNSLCTCKYPKVSLDSPQRRIVIDGANNCSVHSNDNDQENSSKIVYINRKQISNNPTESPIYIGKNKILLTNIKFPRNEKDISQSLLHIQPKVIPTIPLPDGVQILLSNSGDVSYAITQGTELTSEQLSSLPGIMAAVQQQLNSSEMSYQSHSLPNKLACEEVINLSDDEKPEKIEDNNQQGISNIMEKDQTFPSEQSILVTENASPIEISNHHQPESCSTISNTNSSLLIKDHATKNIVPQECENRSIQNNAKYDQVPESNYSDAEKINVNIKDLESPALPGLQMTLTEKNLHTNEEATGVETNILRNSTGDQDRIDNIHVTENLDFNAEFVKMIHSENPDFNYSKDIETDAESNKKNVDPESNNTDLSANRKSLLSDLMEMSGISTEDTTPMSRENMTPVPVITPISLDQTPSQSVELSIVKSFSDLRYACERNGLFFKLDSKTGVIVQINVCIRRKNKVNVDKSIPIAPKEVVDLTDYQDVSVSEYETLDNTQSSTFNIPKIILKRKKLFQQGKLITPIKLFKSTHTRALQRGSKMNQIEATINLLDSDSDNAMEEEYLTNSSDLDNDVLKTVNNYDNESSDDEPLAKKAMRIRSVHVSNETVSRNEIDQMQVERSQESNMSMNANDIEPLRVDIASGEGNHALSPTLSFISNHSNSDAEENCILGV